MSKLSKWANPPGLRSLLRKYGLYLGTNVKDGSAVFLDPARLRTHVDIDGPPGVGKTRLMLSLFQQVCRIPRATVVFVNPKGDAGRQARDWTIANGYGKRLIWFDPGDTSDGYVMGWNPLKPNGLAVATHAKATREAILSSWGNSNFDDTPQLARFLFLALHVVREQHLTLVEALRLLLPGSPLRQALLPVIQDPYVQESLAYLDSLRDSRQDELLASSVAKLEAFVMDPTIRNVLTQQEHSIDFGEVIASHRIFIANIELYKPLRAGDVRTLGRLLVNDLLAHVFNQPEGKRTPVFFICDEVHVAAATDDLCIAIELGRELLFSCIIAHQSPSQLKLEGSPRLYDAVRDCVRTKIVFGGLSAETLEGDGVLKDLVIDTYNPKAVKDELTSLEVEPVNRWHLQVAETESTTVGTASSRGTSNTETEGHSHQWSYQDGVSESEGESESSGTAVGVQALAGVGETVVPGGEIVASTNQTTGDGESSFSGLARSRSRTESHVTGAAEGNSTATSRGVNESTSEQQSAGRSVTRTWVQITDLLKRRVVTSRTFYSLEEFLTMKLQEIKELPDGHFVVKAPHHPAIIVRAPYVRTPRLGVRQRVQGLTRVYGQPCYGTLSEIHSEEGRRREKLIGMAEPGIESSRTPKRKRLSTRSAVIQGEPSARPTGAGTVDLPAMYRGVGLQASSRIEDDLQRAERFYASEDWKESILASRNVLEGVLQDIAEELSRLTLQPLRAEPSPRAVRDYLKETGLLTEDALRILAQTYGRQSDHVHVSGVPDRDDALLWMTQSRSLMYFALHRFQTWRETRGSDASP